MAPVPGYRLASAPPRVPNARMAATACGVMWAARILESLVRVHRNVIPDMREKVKMTRAIDSNSAASVTAGRESGSRQAQRGGALGWRSPRRPSIPT
jgi:hypothetical protein